MSRRAFVEAHLAALRSGVRVDRIVERALEAHLEAAAEAVAKRNGPSGPRR